MFRRLSLALASFSLMSLLAFPGIAHADFNLFGDSCKGTAASSAVCQDANTQNKSNSNPIYGKDGILTKAANIITILIAIVAVIVIIVSGLQFILASGDAGKISTARNAIIYAIVGLVIAVSAQAIIQLVLVRL